MKRAARIEQLPPYLFAELDRKVAAKRASGADVISLGIGDPDPCALVEATPLTTAERRAILGETAARIFHVKCECGAAAAGVTAPAACASLEDASKAHLLRALERCGWRVEGPTGAAHVLGLKPSTLRSQMKKLGLQRVAS